MATHPDYYRTLQVHLRAEKEVIDAAYHKLAAKYHPDVNRAPDALEKMKQINAAYEVLSNPSRRAAYDAAGGRLPRAGQALNTPARAWRRLIIIIILIALAAIAIRFGLIKLVLIIAAFFAVPWILYSLTKPRPRR